MPGGACGALRPAGLSDADHSLHPLYRAWRLPFGPSWRSRRLLRQPLPSKPAPVDDAGRYIVSYDATGPDAVSSGEVIAETREREQDLGFDARHEYRRALKGFAAELSAADVRAAAPGPRGGARVARTFRCVRSRSRLLPRARQCRPAWRGSRRPTAARRTRPARVGVAVLDTGIDLDHPDLVAHDGKNCIASGSADDDNGHGTHVAGTIGARNQGAGVVGVAPGTAVYAVKVLDAQRQRPVVNIICGIDWVTANAASLGINGREHEPRRLGDDYSTCAGDPLHQAICNSTDAGVVYTRRRRQQRLGLGRTAP